MTKMPIYYINLASAAGRRTEMERQFTALGLTAERVEAVTPADISPEDLQTYCNPDRYRWLAPTELACSLSHIKVWRRILQSGAPQAVVFEDDAVLSGRLPAFLGAVKGAELEAELIRLEICPNRVRAEAKPTCVVGGIALVRIFGFSGGTAAYIVSASLAARMIDRSEIRDTPFDRALFDSLKHFSRRLAFLQADPGLAVQADQLPVARSEIEGSYIKSDLQSRFQTRNRSVWRHFLNVARRWVDENINEGIQKSYLDLTGIKKRKIEFLP